MQNQEILKQNENWFREALGSDFTANDAKTQYSVHLEEFAEALDCVAFSSSDPDTHHKINRVALEIKEKIDDLKDMLRLNSTTSMSIIDPVEFLDGLCDTVVTAGAVAYTHNMDLAGAMQEVVASNFSKFVDGKAIFVEGTRKIAKGPDYFRPELAKFVG